MYIVVELKDGDIVGNSQYRGFSINQIASDYGANFVESEASDNHEGILVKDNSVIGRIYEDLT